MDVIVDDAVAVDGNGAIGPKALAARQPARLIEGRGTDDDAWRACSEIARLADVDLETWAARYPRIWIVSPHPDDEVLALGATMARLSRLNADLRVVSVTAGTASHPESERWPVERLALVRPAELRRAIEVLEIDATLFELDVPDGEVSRHEDTIADFLAQRIGAADLVIAPWRWDGHPDHEASAAAAVRAAERIDADLVEYPVWMWHWAKPGDDLIPWERARCVRLGAGERDAKREAIKQFVSQVTPDMHRPAILPPHVVARFTRPCEILFCSNA